MFSLQNKSWIWFLLASNPNQRLMVWFSGNPCQVSAKSEAQRQIFQGFCGSVLNCTWILCFDSSMCSGWFIKWHMQHRRFPFNLYLRVKEFYAFDSKLQTSRYNWPVFLWVVSSSVRGADLGLGRPHLHMVDHYPGKCKAYHNGLANWLWSKMDFPRACPFHHISNITMLCVCV